MINKPNVDCAKNRVKSLIQQYSTNTATCHSLIMLDIWKVKFEYFKLLLNYLCVRRVLPLCVLCFLNVLIGSCNSYFFLTSSFLRLLFYLVNKYKYNYSFYYLMNYGIGFYSVKNLGYVLFLLSIEIFIICI